MATTGDPVFPTGDIEDTDSVEDRHSYLDSDPTLVYQKAQRRRERQRTVAIQKQALALREAQPDLGVDEVLTLAQRMVDSPHEAMEAGWNPMADIIERHDIARQAHRDVAVREAEDQVRATEAPWAKAGLPDPDLANSSEEELLDLLRQQAEKAFANSNFSATAEQDRRRRELGL